jgi:hypothetical protein
MAGVSPRKDREPRTTAPLKDAIPDILTLFLILDFAFKPELFVFIYFVFSLQGKYPYTLSIGQLRIYYKKRSKRIMSIANIANTEYNEKIWKNYNIQVAFISNLIIF